MRLPFLFPFVLFRLLHPMSTIAVTTPSLELRSREDWHPWIWYLKGIATNAMVWEYINPDLPANALKLLQYPHLDIDLTHPADEDILVAYKILTT